MGKDWHGKGQQDREKSRDNDWVDLARGGGGSPDYNPPSGSDKSSYDAGWKNAKK